MLSAFNITQTGQSHLKIDVPCQDYSKTAVVACGDRKVILAAAADGVGTCKFSQIASRTAVEECLEYIKAGLNVTIMNHDELIEGLIHDAYDASIDLLYMKAEVMKESILQFDTTLSCTIYDGNNLWFGHVGDDGIVVMYQSGKYELITKRHKGGEYNSVVPLRYKDSWQFGKAKEPVASFVIMTDGLLDRCVDSASMKNRVYFPFLSPVLSAAPETDEEIAALRTDWEEFLNGNGEYPINIRECVTDDLTLVAGINSDAVKSIDTIIFDNEQWDRDSLLRKQELEEALYAEHKDVYQESEMSFKAEADGGTQWYIKGITGTITLLENLARAVKVRCLKLRGVLIK